MESYDSELVLEQNRLERVKELAQGQLNDALKQASANGAELLAHKREMRENTSGASPAGAGFMDMLDKLIELDGYASAVYTKAAIAELTGSRIPALERMLLTPYFARIDFRFNSEDEDDSEAVYIGRSSLMDEQLCEIYVYDWRAPIASVFYRFGTGAAFYDTPDGKVTGEVGLKRQYEIESGHLKYFFDAEVQVVDEVLRKMLSRNAPQTMKAIVETIQREQDIIIRDMDNDLLMVQGVAGSGKTSVALHRAAYLMYKSLGSRLSYENIIVISPNTLFEQYIANVLPELGERNVETLVFEEIFAGAVGMTVKNIQPRAELLENLLTGHENTILKSGTEFKLSSGFAEILRRFAAGIPRRFIGFTDVYYAGKCIAARQALKSAVLNRSRNEPVLLRLKKLEQKIFERVHELQKNRLKTLRNFVSTKPELQTETDEYARLLSIYECTALAKNIRRFTEPDVRGLYEKLFGDREYFRRLARGIDLPDDIDRIIDDTCAELRGEVLSYADAAALSYLSLILGDGAEKCHGIKQVVIDEAQDYYPLHFEILGQMFGAARFTVLADVNQAVGRKEDLGLYERLPDILRKQKFSLVTMGKSFRCTNEILRFSSQFIHDGTEIQSFNRSGDEPRVAGFADANELAAGVLAESSRYIDAGYRAVAVLCRTRAACESLHKRINDSRVRLIGGAAGAIDELDGIFILPVYLAKGLEFDAAVIADADSYAGTDDDRRLLYVAATRALHSLSVLYTGDKSPLMGGGE